jgi:hypothetical protein
VALVFACLGIALVLVLGVRYLADQRRVAAFSLKSSPSAAPVLPSSPSSDPTVETACKSRTLTAGAQRWKAMPGTEAGFRAHEKWQDITIPHEAVVRTAQVAGSLDATEAGSVITLSGGCFAVDLTTLTSVDTLPIPGVDVRSRDQGFADWLDTNRHPFATLTLGAATLPNFRSQPARFSVAGELSFKGVTRPATVAVEAQSTASGVKATGTTTVDMRQWGVDPPHWQTVVDPMVTIEFLLVLARD